MNETLRACSEIAITSFHPTDHRNTAAPSSVNVCESVRQCHASGPDSCALVSLEETLKHGGGVCGASLLVLDGFLEVLNSITALPDLLKLPGEDLRPPLPGQTRLLQAQLTHLHIVFP